MITLEEAMIYGRNGDIEKASELFNKYYRNELSKYKADFENGIETYLRKGERMVFRNTKIGKTETITADKDGYVVTCRVTFPLHLHYRREPMTPAK